MDGVSDRVQSRDAYAFKYVIIQHRLYLTQIWYYNDKVVWNLWGESHTN